MRVLYFAWVRQLAGVGEEEVSPPAEVGTAEELAVWLRTVSDGRAAALADLESVRVAINAEFADWQDRVSARDEIAFFPPVTGG